MPRRRWRAVEIGLLGERYSEAGLNQLALDLDRSPDSITSQARRLGLRSPHRHRRRALARALNNKSANICFFDHLAEQVAYVLGYIWMRGRVKTNPRHVLRLRCPTTEESTLLEVRSLLRSRHQIQRRETYTICEICSFCLVQSLIRRYGRPPSSDCPEAPLPGLPSPYIHHLARGLILGAGHSNTSRITCTGPYTAMRELQQLAQVATGVSISTSNSSWNSTARPLPVTPDYSPTVNSMTPLD
jgi:hypothetical protein